MFEQIEQKINSAQAINREDALWLLTQADLLKTGRLADNIRQQKHPENRVTFVVDRNVNYSNICESQCKFCAFYRSADAEDAYLLGFDEIFAKVQELVDYGGTQLLMQGGIHPSLTIDWFEDLFRQLAERFPQVQIHSLSPAEVIQIAKLSDLTMEECLARLQKAGLASVPGGGAEILVDSVRKTISPNKIGWKKWAWVMEEAHRLGMRTTATMMFGSAEKPVDIIEHLFRQATGIRIVTRAVITIDERQVVIEWTAIECSTGQLMVRIMSKLIGAFLFLERGQNRAMGNTAQG
jgi:cyclic dehypoxanthinyl futalosine synthase